MNMIVTDYDVGSVLIDNPSFEDDTFTAAGADTYVDGTILARNTASGKLVPWENAGAGGNEIPKAVVYGDIVAAGAGDLPIRPIIAGRVRTEHLIEHGVGTGNIDKAVLDQLRDYNIVALSVTELNFPDNQ